MLPSASDAATSTIISRNISSLGAVDTYDMILNHALLMGGEEIRGTHIAPLGHVAVLLLHCYIYAHWLVAYN